MEIPDIVFAPINSRIGFDTIYYLMMSNGGDFNEALKKCIQIKETWTEIIETIMKDNKNELIYYKS